MKWYEWLLVLSVLAFAAFMPGWTFVICVAVATYLTIETKRKRSRR